DPRGAPPRPRRHQGRGQRLSARRTRESARRARNGNRRRARRRRRPPPTRREDRVNPPLAVTSEWATIVPLRTYTDVAVRGLVDAIATDVGRLRRRYQAIAGAE